MKAKGKKDGIMEVTTIVGGQDNGQVTTQTRQVNRKCWWKANELATNELIAEYRALQRNSTPVSEERNDEGEFKDQGLQKYIDLKWENGDAEQLWDKIAKRLEAENKAANQAIRSGLK